MGFQQAGKEPGAAQQGEGAGQERLDAAGGATLLLSIFAWHFLSASPRFSGEDFLNILELAIATFAFFSHNAE
jgi:hypothetical protein